MKTRDSFYRKVFQWIMGLIAAHSIGFGVALVVLPIPVIEFFGFHLVEKFFAVQGGIFHIVVSIAYIYAAVDPEDSRKMVILACSAKFMATLFLLSYYFFVSHIFMVVYGRPSCIASDLGFLCRPRDLCGDSRIVRALEVILDRCTKFPRSHPRQLGIDTDQYLVHGVYTTLRELCRRLIA